MIAQVLEYLRQIRYTNFLLQDMAMDIHVICLNTNIHLAYCKYCLHFYSITIKTVSSCNFPILTS